MALSTSIPTAETYIEGAIAARAASDTALAMTLCNQALEREPDNLRARLLLADLHADKESWSQMLAVIEDAASGPASARVAYRRGQALAGLGRIDEALDCFEEASLLDPFDPNAWARRALLLDRMGREDEAEDCRARAGELGFNATP
jgi:tetratricopeptide (TPR) repeat protein